MRKLRCLSIFILLILFTACSNQQTHNLKLPHHIDIDTTENQVITVIETSIPTSRLSAQIDEPITDNTEMLKPIIDEINKKCVNFTFENWRITVNYFSDDESTGNLIFRYYIGDSIITNKAVTCLIENDIITQINYSNIDMTTDEATLLDKVDRFTQTHIQEKKQMKSGEEFISEDIRYVYYYNIDTLVYSYTLFFYEDTDIGKVINNEYVSEYIID